MYNECCENDLKSGWITVGWCIYRHMIASLNIEQTSKGGFVSKRLTRAPTTDNINALLSFY